MQSKIVTALTPKALKIEIDFIIAATPGIVFIHVVEMSSARANFVICWK